MPTGYEVDQYRMLQRDVPKIANALGRIADALEVLAHTDTVKRSQRLREDLVEEMDDHGY